MGKVGISCIVDRVGRNLPDLADEGTVAGDDGDGDVCLLDADVEDLDGVDVGGGDGLGDGEGPSSDLTMLQFLNS